MFNYHIINDFQAGEACGVFNLRSAQYKIEIDVISLLCIPIRPLPQKFDATGISCGRGDTLLAPLH